MNAEEADEDSEVWSTYQCRTVPYGHPHPGHIVEADNIAMIPLPPASYPIRDSLDPCIIRGALSSMQIEGILYACERHSKRLPDGSRAGFFLGDSAGAGKGRQVAGIILDNLLRGRKKHVWISASKELARSALQDFSDLGCMITDPRSTRSYFCSSIADLSRTNMVCGVVFATYHELISKGRYDQLCEWLGADFQGVIVFDECHRAKQYTTNKSATHTAEDVVRIQARFPHARIVYSSATGITSIKNMGYMSRMGLWGEHTPYKTFDEFASKFSGVAALEALSLEFKATGARVARNVGYGGTEFRAVEAVLSPDIFHLYRRCAHVWHRMLEYARYAFELCQVTPGEADDGEVLDRALKEEEIKRVERAWKVEYYTRHQSFFRQLITCLKIPTVVQLAKDSLENGGCVVIGLQTTGEAALGKDGERIGIEQPTHGTVVATDKATDTPVSICRGILLEILEKNFPTKQLWVRLPTDPPSQYYCPSRYDLHMELTRTAYRIPGMSPFMFASNVSKFLLDPVPRRSALPDYEADGTVMEALRMKRTLLRMIDSIPFPASSLDELIDQLGGARNVAEITGRTQRQVRQADGSFRLERRPSKEMEMAAFMGDRKRVAIISEAGSTGISLHADPRCANQRRRTHITIELPWAADEAVQQLGRSHRVNQTSAPIFALVYTCFGGENRFVVSLTRKLLSLGALSQGDRRASVPMMQHVPVPYDSVYGERAVRALAEAAWTGGVDPADLDPIEWVRWCEIIRVGHLDREWAGPAAPAAAGAPVGASLAGAPAGSPSTWMSVRPINQHTVSRVIREGFDWVGPMKGMDVDRFFNRLLGLPYTYQSVLFHAFMFRMNEEVERAKQSGTYEHGVQSYVHQHVRRTAPDEVIYRDPGTGGKLLLHYIVRDRGLSLEGALKTFAEKVPGAQGATLADAVAGTAPADVRSYFFTSGRAARQRVLLAIPDQGEGQGNMYRVIRPNVGVYSAIKMMAHDDLHRNYRAVSGMEELAQLWKAEYERSIVECVHGPQCSRMCTDGKRELQTCLLTGNVMSLWKELESMRGNRLSLVHVQMNEGDRLVGVEWKREHVGVLLNTLSSKVRERIRKLQVRTLSGLPINGDRVVLLPPTALRYSKSVMDQTLYSQQNMRYRSWSMAPYTREEQMGIFGYAWDRHSCVTESTLANVPVGTELVSPIQKSWIGGRSSYDITVYLPLTDEQKEEEKRFQREGLRSEPADPVNEGWKGVFFQQAG
jgi:hypothetical protein